MKNIIKYLSKKIILFILIGSMYYGIETIYKGITSGRPSHISMFILAGLCGVFFIDSINNLYSYNLDFLVQIITSTILCTISEGICGYIVNIQMGLKVWDYSNMPMQFLWGQCCVPFTLIWFILVAIGIPLCDAYNYYIFKDNEIPYYNLFGRRIYTFPKRKN